MVSHSFQEGFFPNSYILGAYQPLPGECMCSPSALALPFPFCLLHLYPFYYYFSLYVGIHKTELSAKLLMRWKKLEEDEKVCDSSSPYASKENDVCSVAYHPHD